MKKGIVLLGLILMSNFLFAQQTINLYCYTTPFSTGCVDTSNKMFSGTVDKIATKANSGFMVFDASPLPNNAQILSGEFTFALSCYGISAGDPNQAVKLGIFKFLPRDPRFGAISQNDIKNGQDIGYIEWDVANPLLNLPLKGALDVEGIKYLQKNIGTNLLIGVFPPANSRDIRCIIGYDRMFGKAAPVLKVTYKINDTINQSPKVSFYSNKNYFYLGDTTYFYDNTGNRPNQWTWVFGDGNKSTLKNPKHVYANPGIYSVKLVAKNASGQDSILKTNYIKVDPLPTYPLANFDYDKNYVLIGDSIQFIDLSLNNDGTYYWDFDYKLKPGIKKSTIRNPKFAYSDSGYHSILFAVKNPYGNDTMRKEKIIHVVKGFPPFANFKVEKNYQEVFFSDSSFYQPATWEWDFDFMNNPGTFTSNLANPYHYYDSVGQYTVCLKVENEYGYQTICKEIQIDSLIRGLAPLAGFEYSISELEVQFTDTSKNNPSVWEWDFDTNNNLGKNTSTLQNPKFTFDTSGLYRVCLKSINEFGEDKYCGFVKVEKKIIGNAPNSFFKFSVDKLKVKFTDSSTNNPISRKWDFDSMNNPGIYTSNLTHPEFNFSAEGDYLVCLITENNFGKDTLCKMVKLDTIEANKPISIFKYTIGSNYVAFVDSSLYAPTNYFWDFNSINNPGVEISSEKNPIHYYSGPGTYEVCLKVWNFVGADSSCKIVQIEKPNGISDFNLTDQIKIYPNPVNDWLTIETKFSRIENQKLNIQIVDLLGRVVESTTIYENLEMINTSKLKKGIYFVTFPEIGVNFLMEKIGETAN